MIGFITNLNRFMGAVFSYGYAVVAVLTFGEVCARYVFNSPTQWTIEIVVMLASAHYIIGGPQAYATDGHIRITVLYDKLPERVQAVLTFVERLVVCASCATVAIWAVRQADRAITIGERTGSNFNTLSPTILKIVLAVAMVLFTLQAVAHVLRGGRVDEEARAGVEGVEHGR